jgi:hypothetical protein
MPNLSICIILHKTAENGGFSGCFDAKRGFLRLFRGFFTQKFIDFFKKNIFSVRFFPI